MQDFPHHYAVAADAEPQGNVKLTSPGVEAIDSAPPAEFGGPGDRWSPESLLVASVADCFILSFRAISRASKFDWISLKCDADGVLERPDRVTQFTEFQLRAVLEVPHGTDPDKARRLLDKAEHTCLITNSLKASSLLDAEIIVVD
jgi:organic hydroperoxide reductase OsmC/OhrA